MGHGYRLAMARKGFSSHLSYSHIDLGILPGVLGAMASSPTLPALFLPSAFEAHLYIPPSIRKKRDSERSGVKREESYVTLRLQVGWFRAGLCPMGDSEFWLRLSMPLNLPCLLPHSLCHIQLSSWWCCKFHSDHLWGLPLLLSCYWQEMAEA